MNQIRNDERKIRRNPRVMTTTSVEENDEITIDLFEVFNAIKKHLILLIVIVVLVGGASGVFTKFFMKPIYQSSGTIFLTPQVSNEGQVDYNSALTNSRLINNVVSLITQDNIMTKVAERTGMESADSVRNVLTVTNQDNTEVVTVTSKTADPKKSKAIVEETITVFIDTMQENLNLKNIEVVNPPALSYEPVGPSTVKNTMIGAMCGLVLGLGYIFIGILTNTRLKTKEEAEKYLGLPVFCEIPDIK